MGQDQGRDSPAADGAVLRGLLFAAPAAALLWLAIAAAIALRYLN